MLFYVVSVVSRWMGVLDGVEIVEGKGQFWGKCGAWVAMRLFLNYFGILLLRFVRNAWLLTVVMFWLMLSGCVSVCMCVKLVYCG